jgi:uncharacterized protein
MIWNVMLASVVAIAARRLPVASAGRARKPFVAATSGAMAMEPAPIEPSWIISGAPNARKADVSRSEDGASVTAIWDCTAGEFRWYFGWDETVTILEGEVHVTAEGGATRTLRAGDVGFFAGGTWATWRIDNYLKKVAVCRKPFPRPLALAYKLRNSLRRGTPIGLAA